MIRFESLEFVQTGLLKYVREETSGYARTRYLNDVKARFLDSAKAWTLQYVQVGSMSPACRECKIHCNFPYFQNFYYLINKDSLSQSIAKSITASIIIKITSPTSGN